LDSPLRKRLVRDGKLKLSMGDYDKVSRSLREHFGKYAGYAQQYLYMTAREAGA
jgi:3-methyladenine DNA glycosylase/8-oxoguanine DNA glycosylase